MKRSYLAGLIMLPAAAAILASCAMTPAQQTQVNNLAAAVEPLVQAYAQSGHVTEAQAIPAALNSLAVFDPAAQVDTAQLSASIESTVNAFTNHTGSSTAQKIAAVVVGVLPPNPNGAQANAALIQAGAAAGNGANN